MKISTAHFSYMRNEAHYQFLLLVKQLFEAEPGVAGIVTELLPQFYALLELEGRLVDVVRTSEYTRQLADADRRRDRAVAGLNIAIEAALHHPDPDVLKAAERLRIRMKAFRGEIERKAYGEESAAVKILVTDLQGAYAPQVSTVGLGVWGTEIAAAQALFEQIFLLRNAERVERSRENIRDVRRNIETLYRRIVEHINAYTLINGTATTGVFTGRLNDEIAYFNEHSRHRHLPRDINLATVASIPNQLWDGSQPVTPLPVVTDEKGNLLVFARDYDLRYRNNDRPGNATVTLHGRGAWKNRKTVSFNIIEKRRFHQ
jgi:hypothetical protein